MVVDDDLVLIRTVEALLMKEGFEVITQTDGISALIKIKEQRPDLVILDIMMPKMDGFNVCRILKFDEKYQSIPILILTAREKPEDKEMAQEVKADAFMVKPFRHEQLLEEINRLLLLN